MGTKNGEGRGKMDLNLIKSTSIQYLKSIGKFFFGGHLPRIGYLTHLGIYALAAAIVVWPANTYIWTSPVLVADAYPYFAICFLWLLVIGFFSTYLKTTNGRGIRWYWAILIGFILPIGLLYLHLDQYIGDRDRYGSTISEIFLYASLFICLGLPLFIRGSKQVDFGGDDFSIRQIGTGMPLITLVVSGVIVIPLSIYAGFFQDGLWVGRKQFDHIRFIAPLTTSDNGSFIATCGNLTGVSAYSQSGPGKGFIRDGFADTRIGIFVAKDRSIDVISDGPNGRISYRNDGFRISVGGLLLSGSDSYFQLDSSVNRFIVSADSSDFSPEKAGAVWTFVFTKFNGRDWDVVMTGAKSRPEFEFLKKVEAHAMANLVVGSCSVRQASKS